MIINKQKNTRRNFIHLYNRKEEGFGSYDVNYINAYRKELAVKVKKQAHERKVV
mgnify:CR=1 FL=1|tara:strand:+ start:317 stop:478 length:162 start_codon:yes stop_codon:yes gene_type:complete